MSLIVLLAAAISCGKKLPPIAPESVVPEAVKDFRVISRDAKLMMVFTKPSKNVDGSKLTDMAGVKVMRRVAEDKAGCKGCPKKFPVAYDIDAEYPVGAIIEGDRVVYADEDVQEGIKYEYKAVPYNKDGYEGPESQKIGFLWERPPGKPMNITGKAGDKVVDLEWLPSTDTAEIVGYNVYRREGEHKFSIDPVNKTLIKDTRFPDFGLKNDKAYYYTVRAVRSANESLIEGPSAEDVMLIPKEAVIEELKGEGR